MTDTTGNAGIDATNLGGAATQAALNIFPATVAFSAAILCALASELLIWYIIYRHDDYKKLCSRFEDEQNKLEAMKEKLMYTAGTQTQNAQKAAERKTKIAEDSVKDVQGRLMVKKTRGMMCVGVFMMVAIGTLNSYWSGTVAGRLPFTPWSFATGMLHYGIPGEDYRECSITAIFVLSNVSVGAYVKRILALEGPRVSMPNPYA